MLHCEYRDESDEDRLVEATEAKQKELKSLCWYAKLVMDIKLTIKQPQHSKDTARTFLMIVISGFDAS